MPKIDDPQVVALLRRGYAIQEAAAKLADPGGGDLAAALATAKGEVASMACSTVTVATTTSTDVAGWQIVVPANSGPVTVKAVGILLALVTGTLAANVNQYGQLKILDESNNLIAFTKWAAAPSGTSFTNVNTLSMEADVPNNASAKTYRVQIQCASVSSGSSVTLHTSASGFTDPQLKAIRR